MHLLVPLAGLLGLEVAAVKERIMRSLVGSAIMIVFALVGVSFLLAAAFFAISTAIGPIYSALTLAGIFLLAALAVYLSLRAGAARARLAAAEKRRSSEAGAFATTAALTALPVLLRSPAVRTLALPAAAIAAVFLVRGGRK